VEKPVIDYRTGNNAKGVRLTHADLETLLFLFEHKLISQTQLYEFYTLIKDIHYDSFRKRMNKFAKNGIIQFKKYEITKKRKGVVKNLILLDTKGYEILYAAGLLERMDNPYQNRTNWDRLLATKEVVLQAIKLDMQRTGLLIGGDNKHLYILQKEKALKQNLIKEEDIRKEKMILHEVKKPLVLNYDSKPFVLKPNILYSFSSYRTMFPNIEHHAEPDWILGINQNILNIEIDTGYRTLIKEESETISVDEQMKKYIELSEQFSSLKHTVLYIYMDDSFPFRKNYGRKTQRIKNFKQFIMQEEKIRNSSLNIFVSSLERSKYILGHLLSCFRGILNKEKMLREAMTCLMETLEAEHKYTILHFKNREEIIRNFSLPAYQLSVDELLSITWKDGDQPKERVLIPFVLFEGDVRSQDEVQLLSKQLKENKLIWGLPDDSKILIIYPDQNSMKGDILRNDIPNDSVCFSNMEDLKRYCSSNQPLKLYDITRKGEWPFEYATRCIES
jgi:hypothetical protein